jgi:hypothetical protein
MNRPLCLVIIAIVLFAGRAIGASISGTVTNIDPKSGSLTVLAGPSPTIYHFRPGVETVLLGQHSSVDKIKPGMIVTLSSAEPGLITTIYVTSAAPQIGAVNTAPDKSSFATVESIAALVPPTIALKQGTNWNPVAIKDANDALAAQVHGQSITVRGKVESIDGIKEGDYTMGILMISKVNIHGVPMSCRIEFKFRPEEEHTLVKIHKDSTIMVSGTVTRSTFYDWGGEVLGVYVMDAKIAK